MKRIVTGFYIISFMLLSWTTSYGQVTHSTIHPTVPYSKVPPLITPPVMHFSSRFNTLSSTADTVMAYFDPDSTGNFNWYFLPSHLTLNSGTSSNPIDTQYVINRYAERFTLPKVSPWTTRYLDSVEILMAPVTLPQDGTTDSLVIELRPGITLFEQPNNDTLFGFNAINAPLRTAVITTDNLVATQVYDTVINFNYKLPASIASDFFIDLYATDTDLTETQFAIRGDSVTFNPPLEDPLTASDQDIYRGMWAVDDPTDPTYPYFENDYAGLQFTNQDGSQTDYFYTNFVIIAYMSNAAESAVDENGNPQNVLEPNFPNPVSSSTEIDYSLATSAPVSLSVYNELGQQVSTIVSDVQSAGGHSAIFNTGTLPDGIYYYTLQSGEFTATNSMVIAR